MAQFGSLQTRETLVSTSFGFNTSHCDDDSIDPHENMTPLSPRANEVLDGTTPPSFEAILSGHSAAPFSRVAFSDFLKKMYCSENLEFLISSDRLLTTDLMDHKQREQIWHYIYANFISTDSPKEVNIPHELKHQLSECFERDDIPPSDLIVRTMLSIKDLLRDAYVLFIQGVKQSNHRDSYFNDRVNGNYCLLPTPTDETPNPHRRFSENYSPLDPPSSVSSRCASPLSGTDVSVLNDFPTRGQPIPRSDGVAVYSSNESLKQADKKESISSMKSAKSSSVSEPSGLKKFAGKLGRWRRLSSNSSTGSSS